ncbi:MAG: HAMP domain-containing histidine kinase [Alphaproteobacteria bacterium]
MIEALRLVSRSLAARFFLLVLAFAAVPLILYGEFHGAEKIRRAALLSTLQSDGHLIAQAMRIGLERVRQPSIVETRALLERIGPTGLNMKMRLLFRPAGGEAGGKDGGEEGGLFLIAASPPLSADGLERERRELAASGVIRTIPSSCDGTTPLDLRYRDPDGDEEVLTSITPFSTPAGCWAVITSHSTRDGPGSLLGRPYWRAYEVQMAAVIYAVLALLVLTLVGGLWRGLRRFGRQARAIGSGHTPKTRFACLNRIPELASVADEFDRMVATLRASADAFRHAAEDNAHAFKTPIATIAQAIEPLRGALPAGSGAERSLQLIEASVARLDALVQAARCMDEASAALVHPPRQRVDLSRLVSTILDTCESTALVRRVTFGRKIAEECVVWAGAELLETVVENILDNALSFSPEGGVVTVGVARGGRTIVLTIEDEGPGAPGEVLECMFQRYVSYRPTADRAAAESHFGIGLWIARRNVEAVGGSIHAGNRDGGGLRMTVSLPSAG